MDIQSPFGSNNCSGGVNPYSWPEWKSETTTIRFVLLIPDIMFPEPLLLIFLSLPVFLGGAQPIPLRLMQTTKLANVARELEPTVDCENP
jgi:hypothetical protein